MDLVRTERVYLIKMVDRGDHTETYTGPGVVVGVYSGGVMVRELDNTKEPWWVPRRLWGVNLVKVTT